MKRMKKFIVMLLVLSILMVSLSSCYGSFTLTKKLYKFNGTVGNKFIQTLVMWIFIGVPVYSTCGFIDFVVLNTIEFWTGANPLAMNSGDQEIKYYTDNGINYKVITSQNRYDIYDLDNPAHDVSFVFDAQNENWLMEKDGKQVTIVDANAKLVKFFTPEGKLHKVQTN